MTGTDHLARGIYALTRTRVSPTIHNCPASDLPTNARSSRVPIASVWCRAWLSSRKNDNAWASTRWILADIRETRVESDDCSVFAAAHGGEVLVSRATEPLIENSLGIVPRLAEQVTEFGRKILV